MEIHSYRPCLCGTGSPAEQRAFARQYDRAIVDLTPGSISIVVDRLFAKGLVTRVESTEDRRVRIIALTLDGKTSSFTLSESIPGR